MKLNLVQLFDIYLFYRNKNRKCKFLELSYACTLCIKQNAAQLFLFFSIFYLINHMTQLKSLHLNVGKFSNTKITDIYSL